MFSILLHSSKTMRPFIHVPTSYHEPALLEKANRLAAYVQTLTPEQLSKHMAISASQAAKTHALWQAWSSDPARTTPAIDAFIGDIYSGLQVRDFTESDRLYAHKQLFILSGLYGVLRALDNIAAYRLEMAYRFPDDPYQSMYTFWGDAIARQLPPERTIINLSAVEYTKAVLPYLSRTPVIAPKFMTRGKTGQPSQVVVHAKIARGAFAHWMIKERIDTTADLQQFQDLNYRYHPELSTPQQPVFVCDTFGGIGLSVRLT